MTLCWPCVSKKIKQPISQLIAMAQAQGAFKGEARACYGVCDNCGKEDHGVRGEDKFTRKRKP